MRRSAQLWPGPSDRTGMAVTMTGFGGALPFRTPTAGQTQSPESKQAQVNAQADMLQAMRGVELPMKMVAAKLQDGQGVDLYM